MRFTVFLKNDRPSSFEFDPNYEEPLRKRLLEEDETMDVEPPKQLKKTSSDVEQKDKETPAPIINQEHLDYLKKQKNDVVSVLLKLL